MSEEVARGRRDAITHQSEVDIVRIRRSELIKMRSLVENFLQANAGDFIMLGRTQPKRSVITNMEDIEYVLGYLKGLT